jgi:phosphoribosylformimino-5-aminoimidazole carboxamide ribotide isomerase
MLIIPAIDILDGKVVRLTQGRYNEVITYDNNPLDVANNWVAQGAKVLHIVDLNGARDGIPKNLPLVANILRNVNAPVSVQFGGGVRKKEDLEDAVEVGVDKVIIGTQACEDPEFLKHAVEEYKKIIAVSIDVKYSRVATSGWTQTTRFDAVDIARRVQDLGVETVIYTDISRDGTMSGPNIDTLKKFLEATSLSVIISGGITSTEDIKALKRLQTLGLTGAIIGKALYEKKISLRTAIITAEKEGRRDADRK